VDVPEFNFIMVDGKGDPKRAEFQDTVNVLCSLSFTLKFTVKKEKATDYPVMALEGLWWGGAGGLDKAHRVLSRIEKKATTNSIWATKRRTNPTRTIVVAAPMR
jgi:hypothetical protein